MTVARIVARTSTLCTLVIMLTHLCQSDAFGQVEVARPPDDAVQTFFVDAIAFAGSSPSQSRLDVFISVGYDNLSFVKQDDRYYASYEMTLSVYDSTGTLVNEKLWNEEIKGVDFEESVSPRSYSLSERVFLLSPGMYQVSAVVRDNESKTSKRVTQKLRVADFSRASFALSDIMLVSRLTVKGERRAIVPSVSPNLGNVPGAFYAYFEIYNAQNVDSVQLVYTIINETGTLVARADTSRGLKPGRNDMLMRVDHTRLTLGDYVLNIQAFPLRMRSPEQMSQLGTASRGFIVRWQGVPRGVKDLDLAIDQLRYIARDGELDTLKEAETVEEKQRRFLEFWKQKDPNPNTPRNERLEEYYARVEYANKHFSHYQEGWRTDMGMVYIIFGSPNNVDRHPFDVDSKPYEVWSYYELNYQFVFVDQTGFGDYRLLTPIWEVWQRPRR